MQAFGNLPDGLFQCITGGGRVGARLCESRDTHMVAFTGGIETGKAVARACAENFKPTLIEASGNDPFIVMPSAPLDRAVRGATFAAYLNCGQVCTSAERIYVHDSIYESFVEQLTAAARSLRIGNGLDKVDIGPMVSRRERERFEGVLANAVSEGAKIMTGGKRPEHLPGGWFMEPTVLAEVTPDMAILNNESFGPVAPVCRVADLDEALELANRSSYGLGATVYTTDMNETMRAMREIEAGMVWINAPLLDNDAGPFGGRKMSGMGRELGPEGLETFRQNKLVMIDPGEQQFNTRHGHKPVACQYDAPASATAIRHLGTVQFQCPHQIGDIGKTVCTQVIGNALIDLLQQQRFVKQRRTNTDRTGTGDDEFDGVAGVADPALANDGDMVFTRNLVHLVHLEQGDGLDGRTREAALVVTDNGLTRIDINGHTHERIDHGERIGPGLDATPGVLRDVGLVG
jgi:delta 1-pyrroline-5-carboxylate dehydrogenase